MRNTTCCLENCKGFEGKAAQNEFGSGEPNCVQSHENLSISAKIRGGCRYIITLVSYRAGDGKACIADHQIQGAAFNLRAAAPPRSCIQTSNFFRK